MTDHLELVPEQVEPRQLLLGQLLDANEHLRGQVERMQRRAVLRKRQRIRLAIACSLLASMGTWAVAARAAGEAATLGERQVIANPCDRQHLLDCRRAVTWWRKVARERRDAVRWQRAERMRLRGLLVQRVSLGDVSAWTCIHQHEGAWDDQGDPYWGGLQMDRSFQATYGADMIRRHGGQLANAWTPREQIQVAQRAYRTRGYHPWPNTARMCGLL